MKVYMSDESVYDDVSYIEGSVSSEMVIHFRLDYDPVIVWAEDISFIKDSTID